MSNQKLPLPCSAANEIFEDRLPRITVAIPLDHGIAKRKRSLRMLAHALLRGLRDCGLPPPVAIRIDDEIEIEIEFEGHIFLNIWRSRARPSRALLAGCRECGGFVEMRRVSQGTPKPGVVYHRTPPDKNAAPR